MANAEMKVKIEEVVPDFDYPLTPGEMQQLDTKAHIWGDYEKRTRWLMHTIRNKMRSAVCSKMARYSELNTASKKKQMKWADKVLAYIFEEADECPEKLLEPAEDAKMLLLRWYPSHENLRGWYDEARAVLEALAKVHPVYKYIRSMEGFERIQGIGVYNFGTIWAESGNLHAYHSAAAYQKFSGTIKWGPETYGTTDNGTLIRGHRKYLHPCFRVASLQWMRNLDSKYPQMYRDRLQYEKENDKRYKGVEWRRIKALYDEDPDQDVVAKNRRGKVQSNFEGKAKDVLPAKTSELRKLARRYCESQFAAELWKIWTDVAPDTPRATQRREDALRKKYGENWRECYEDQKERDQRHLQRMGLVDAA